MKVLLLIEDTALAEVLAEALGETGHTPELADPGVLDAALGRTRFDVAIVDLDTRARDGARLVTRLRASAPRTRVVALLPCGGLEAGAPPLPYHVGLEKPARLAAVLAAVASGTDSLQNA